MVVDDKTRREFCVEACRGASIAATSGTLLALLQGCRGGNLTITL